MSMEDYSAYKASGTNPTGVYQVVALYEGCIKMMYQARDAVEERNHEKRFNLLRKVSLIIKGLRRCLDTESAPEVSQVLKNYYEIMEANLVRLNLRNEVEVCDQVIKNLKEMHETWKNVASETNKASDLSDDEAVSLSSDARSSLSGVVMDDGVVTDEPYVSTVDDVALPNSMRPYGNIVEPHLYSDASQSDDAFIAGNLVAETLLNRDFEA